MGTSQPAATRVRHHLDRRADQIAEKIVGDEDELLTTSDVGELLGVSTQFLEIGRHKGYGPPFVRLSARAVRYRRDDLRAWLRERKHASVAEYRGTKGTERGAK